MSSVFWERLDALLAQSRIVIDRPRGSHHPRFPQIVYEIDYGYLDGTTSTMPLYVPSIWTSVTPR